MANPPTPTSGVRYLVDYSQHYVPVATEVHGICQVAKGIYELVTLKVFSRSIRGNNSDTAGVHYEKGCKKVGEGIWELLPSAILFTSAYFIHRHRVKPINVSTDISTGSIDL